MSEQGLEIIESSTQKTDEWIGSIAAAAHLEKRDAYKALRAVLQTMRDRLPLNDAVHFAAQLPMFLRGLFYEGWEPSQVPIKMPREEFLAAIQEKNRFRPGDRSDTNHASGLLSHYELRWHWGDGKGAALFPKRHAGAFARLGRRALTAPV
jgi:uncharacterized protein (DUF2267 family)